MTDEEREGRREVKEIMRNQNKAKNRNTDTNTDVCNLPILPTPYAFGQNNVQIVRPSRQKKVRLGSWGGKGLDCPTHNGYLVQNRRHHARCTDVAHAGKANGLRRDEYVNIRQVRYHRQE